LASPNSPVTGSPLPVVGNRVIDRQNPLGDACRQIVDEPGGANGGASAAIVHQSNAGMMKANIMRF
jgi:hypothetical protein